MSMPEPAFEANGDPTEATLKIIEVWPYRDFHTLMEFVRKAWSEFGRFELNGHFYILVTGGHSGNEAVIAALSNNQDFWLTCWETSRRGGYYEFAVPRRPQAAAGMTGGSIPPASEGGLQPPPPPATASDYDGPFGDFP